MVWADFRRRMFTLYIPRVSIFPDMISWKEGVYIYPMFQYPLHSPGSCLVPPTSYSANNSYAIQHRGQISYNARSEQTPGFKAPDWCLPLTHV